MAQQIINIGTVANDGTGDPLRDAMDKVNDNFTELYSGSTAARGTISGTTSTIANNASANVTISGYKGYLLYKIQTSAAAWVRIYMDTGSRSADSARTQSEFPEDGAGVVAEVITTGAETVLISPGVVGFNNENPTTNTIPIAVTNLSGSSAAITVTLTAVQMEV